MGMQRTPYCCNLDHSDPELMLPQLAGTYTQTRSWPSNANYLSALNALTIDYLRIVTQSNPCISEIREKNPKEEVKGRSPFVPNLSANFWRMMVLAGGGVM
jgi:hypothetical protein